MASQQVRAKKGDKGVPLRQKAALGRSRILRDRPSFRKPRSHVHVNLHSVVVHEVLVPRGSCARMAVLDRLPARRRRHAPTPSSTAHCVESATNADDGSRMPDRLKCWLQPLLHQRGNGVCACKPYMYMHRSLHARSLYTIYLTRVFHSIQLTRVIHTIYSPRVINNQQHHMTSSNETLTT